MAGMSSERHDELASGLSAFADSVVPVVREVVGDEAYLLAMDGLAASDGVAGSCAALAVALINSRGGVEGRQWTAAGVMTAGEPADVNLRMAATLNFLIGLTASFTRRDADETFLHVVDLVNFG
jgi:hypothetical protein